MKKQLLNLSLAIAAMLFAFSVAAQDGEATILYSLDCAPDVDGQIENTWVGLEQHDFESTVFQAETPTLDVAYWKAFYNDTAVFVLMHAVEDDWVPSWISGLADWASDKTETYFDVNATLDDGGGPAATAGHYQVSNNWMPGGEVGGIVYDDNSTDGHMFSADTYDSTVVTWTIEYSVAFANLLDDTEAALDPVARADIGFDVTICDLDVAFDGARQRAVWSNLGGVDECWNNMDDAGVMTFGIEEIEVCDPTVEIQGLSNVTLDNSFVYPTLATTTLNLTEVADVTIYNISGAVVMEENNVNMVNVSSLNSGVYFIKSENKVARFVVQ